MKLVTISDTHYQHKNLVLPEGDVLIHSGDALKYGTLTELDNFMFWFNAQPHKYKIYVPGNHDICMQNSSISSKNIIDVAFKKDHYGEHFVLMDDFCIIDGIKFYGFPNSPQFGNWAFMKDETQMGKYIDAIELDTDVLISHGPPYHMFDKTDRGDYAGNKLLNNKIIEIKPKLCVFGHIHEGYGRLSIDNTTYINASVVNSNYKLVNNPQIFDI